ncbi:chitobiase/beta-hexosaminidase C-terminal domain-containing protein [Metabacillus fastidiosus]|uniref:chitobiase/beta-hexosaminidase C-terminal domain-containing protein n=1 Tax=Metabacillus fastidiosus TaxID=1458 RepID=UPI002DB9B98A|nr:chitobiase/beta-hexosaminidase C-terminal domain-containing protein [Metabacillus fastidiosus]MEC2077843.1 chitobiase/beta-hexosaminidase C-terminal domain-containing protein [Metabacillus fastidiosus]
MNKGKWKKPLSTFLSVSLAANILLPAIPAKANTVGPAADLIISEYIEGSSFNKAIELYNGTGASVDLSKYSLELYSNGVEVATKALKLTGELENGKTYVISHAQAAESIKSKAQLLDSAVMNHNGDDAFVLRNGTEVIDSFGTVGEDPGTAWGSTVKTADMTLIRKSSVTKGDTDPFNAFDPAEEWTNLPKDDASDLGKHKMDNPVQSETKTESVTASETSETVKEGTQVTLASATEGAKIYYTVDGTEPTIESNIYSEPITINKSMTIKAFAIADGLESSDIKTFTYTISGDTTIADVRALPIGSQISTKGIVTAILKNTAHIQDETGAIAIHPVSAVNAAVGDEVEVTGKLADYKGLLQIGTAVVKKLGTVGTPASKVLTGADLKEENESVLATVKNVELTDVQTGTGWANYTATDGTQFLVRDERGSLNLVKGKMYDSVTGIVQEFDGAFQIIPRSAADIVEDESTVQQVTASVSGTVEKGTKVTLASATDGAKIYYTIDGSQPTADSPVYSEPITINENTTIKAYAVKEGLKNSAVTTYEYKVFNPEQGLQIHHIQGASHYSAMKGELVKGIEGIVTYKYNIGSNQYFHIQTPDDKKDNDPKTSEGIIVYTGTTAKNVKLGDLVRVDGKVDEFQIDGYSDTKRDTDLPVTQIDARSGNVATVSSNNPLPAPIEIGDNLPTGKIDSDSLAVFNPDTDAIDFWESLEGMRVVIKDSTRAVSPQEHGDLIVVRDSVTADTINGGVRLTKDDANPERIQFKLYPNNDARKFDVKTGDTFEGNIEGVVNYGFQNYKIYADLDYIKGKHAVGQAKPEKTSIVFDENKLTIASYNLENFSNNTAPNETPEDKVNKLARAFVEDMKNPDIIGVTEVQDNNGQVNDSTVDATESYNRLINKIKSIGGEEYKFVNINPENNQDGGAPGANIRVGFLYNAKRVSLTGGEKPGTATDAVGYKDGKLTLNPGRIDPTNAVFNNTRKPLAAQFTFKGKDVVVVANHFNSKSGDTPLFGSKQPPVYGSEAKRQEMSVVVNNFVKNIKADNADANVVVLGDLNDFEFSKTLDVLKGNELINMIDKAEEKERYTYLFQGNSQVLDHILVTNNLANSTLVDIVHINADFTDMGGRASDHDPVLIQTDLAGIKETVQPLIPKQIYNFKKSTVNNIVITTPYTLVNVDEDVTIKKEIVLKTTAILKGEGLKRTKVVIKPTSKKEDTIIDLSGATIKEVVIDNANVKEIRGAENVQKWTVPNGIDTSEIKFYNAKGEAVASPFVPKENKAPIISLAFLTHYVNKNETVKIDLSKHFSDPENDPLTYETTFGAINGTILAVPSDLPGTFNVKVKASDGRSTVEAAFLIVVKNSDPSIRTYYKEADGKLRKELKITLHNIIKDHTTLSYSEARYALEKTDEDPNNPNNVILLYTGRSQAKSTFGSGADNWNREHVWAQSHGNFGTAKGPGTDIHQLRPTDASVNSSRGNLDFDNGGTPHKECTQCKSDSDSWEPPDRVKGDIARILFYMDVRYEESQLNLELVDRTGTSGPYHGKLSTLLQWHKQDAVDEFERNRNNLIYEQYQHNRNPFIDHPEFAEMIWG